MAITLKITPRKIGEDQCPLRAGPDVGTGKPGSCLGPDRYKTQSKREMYQPCAPATQIATYTKDY